MKTYLGKIASLVFLILAFSGTLVYAEQEELYSDECCETGYITYIPSESEDAELFSENLKQKICDGLFSIDQFIDISEYDIYINSNDANNLNYLTNTYKQIIYENYDLFYATERYTYHYTNQGKINKIEPLYRTTDKTEIEKTQKKMNARIEEILSYTTKDMNNIQKLLTVHDRLILECAYDEDYGNILDYCYTSKDVLINGTGVCQGYTITLYELAKRLGISGGYVASDEMHHIWNIFKIDGEWYHVDATWDDPTHDTVGLVRHNFFLKSDSWMNSTAGRHFGFSTPVTTDDDFDNAFWNNIISPIITIDEEMYYVAGTLGDYYISKYDLDDEESEVVTTFIDYWNCYETGNTVYRLPYSGLSYYNDKLYYNTSSQIYSVDLEGSNKNSIFMLDSKNKDSIYGCFIRDDMLYYSYGPKNTFTIDGNGFTKQDCIDTKIPVIGIKLNKKDIVLETDKTKKIKATVLPHNATNKNVYWESSNEAVATVEDGHITAVSEGFTTITVTTEDGHFSESVNVEVIAKVIPGELTGDGQTDVNDAILLLQHSMFPDLYPINYKKSVDFTNDGKVDVNDAILLLQYSMFPDLYPLLGQDDEDDTDTMLYLSGETYTGYEGAYSQNCNNIAVVKNPDDGNDLVLYLETNVTDRQSWTYFWYPCEWVPGERYLISYSVRPANDAYGNPVESGLIGTNVRTNAKDKGVGGALVSADEWTKFECIYTIPFDTDTKKDMKFGIFASPIKVDGYDHNLAWSFYLDNISIVTYDGDEKDGVRSIIYYLNSSYLLDKPSK